ncbi:MAG TPA: hypothetical protein VKM55_24615 [Candidatus Lokiarchaeia archaeon]|nr:hypothetical protein [Candidatus Lokiarchaeia archaeon]
MDRTTSSDPGGRFRIAGMAICPTPIHVLHGEGGESVTERYR